MELAENAAVSDDSLLHIARKVAKAADSKVDTKTLASRLAALRDYLNSGKVLRKNVYPLVFFSAPVFRLEHREGGRLTHILTHTLRELKGKQG